MSKNYCCVCARQITSNNVSDNYEAPGPVTLMGFGEYCCSECSKDLDENGLFPEERDSFYK